MDTRNVLFSSLCLVWLLTSCAGTAMRANMRMVEGEYPQAIALFEKALGETPDNWQAAVRLAYTRYKADQPQQCLALSESQLERHPDNPYLTFYAGLCALASGDPQLAAGHWERFDGARYVDDAVELLVVSTGSLKAGAMAPKDWRVLADQALASAEHGMAQQKAADRYVTMAGYSTLDEGELQPWMAQRERYLP